MLCDVGVGKDAVIDVTEIVAETPAPTKTKDGSKSEETLDVKTDLTPDLEDDKMQVRIQYL